VQRTTDRLSVADMAALTGNMHVKFSQQYSTSLGHDKRSKQELKDTCP
jgi:leucyl aminopeptidase